MTFTVAFRVDDKRASRHGEVVKATGDRLEADKLSPGTLVLYNNHERVTTLEKSSIKYIVSGDQSGPSAPDPGERLGLPGGVF